MTNKSFHTKTASQQLHTMVNYGTELWFNMELDERSCRALGAAKEN